MSPLNGILRRAAPVARLGDLVTKRAAASASMSTNGTNGHPTGPGKDPEAMLEYVLDRVKAHKLLSCRVDRESKVVDFVHPAELTKKMALEIGAAPAEETQLEEIVEKVIKYSVHATHPYFFNQLYGGVDEYGLAGAWLTEALNTNSHTFECAPVFICAERAVFRWVAEKFGMDPNTSDGITCPGGSLANMYGMMLARHVKFPSAKSKGLRCMEEANSGSLVAFTSEESHYSIAKGANWLGLGTENVVKVKTDSRGRMDPELLDAAMTKSKTEGNLPFFVNCTSGSTVMGAYEELDKISQVCKKHGVWMHVDTAWGGGAIMSKKYRHVLKGSGLADSIAWNPHKMLCSPLQTSLFVTSHKGLLHQTNCASATYLFQQDKFYDVSYDTGDKSLQCGRKADAFKFWFLLKSRGEDYLEWAVDNCFAAAEHLHQLVRQTQGFRPAFDFGFDNGMNCTNVCFEYIPPRLRGRADEGSKEWKAEMNKVAPAIKEAMIMKGSMMIGYQPLPHKGKDNFFRVVIASNPPPTKADMQYIIDEIDRCGKDL